MNLKPLDYKIFDEIELIRENSKNEKRNIKLLDYGSGTPNSIRTLEESYLGVLRETTIKDICSVGLKGKWAEIVYALVKQYKPSNILELGTCCGFSSIYMAKASTTSSIHTIEGDETIADIAREHIRKATCNNIIQHVGRFQDILDDVLSEIKSVDFAFIDGHHDENATLIYFNKIKPFLKQDSIIVFDDIEWSEGMKRAWSKIQQDPYIQRSKDFGKLGVCYISLPNVK